MASALKLCALSKAKGVHPFFVKPSDLTSESHLIYSSRLFFFCTLQVISAKSLHLNHGPANRAPGDGHRIRDSAKQPDDSRRPTLQSEAAS